MIAKDVVSRLCPEAAPKILDIRRPTFENSIREQVLDGLSKQPRTLPALLFYNTEGLEHWNHHSHQPEFYPRRQEMSILRQQAYEMASRIVENTVVVDLGSASLDKVMFLLQALEAQQKAITYLALDLSAEQLESTLEAISGHEFHYVRISALHGTFDDGLLWLRETPEVRDLPHCMLLFGLTVGNFSRQNAAAFLRNIASHALTNPQSSILLTLDSCKVPSQILKAYNADGVVPFALASLTYANVLLGGGTEGHVSKIFDINEWYFLSEWNYILGRHEASLIPRSKNIALEGPLNGVVVSKEEKVRFGCSYKYDEEERKTLFLEAGLEEAHVYSGDGYDVAFYELKHVHGS